MKILSMILAGGEGKRLWPLTAERAKPAVPFGGRYRLIDLVLSNFVNSGLYKIKVLTQYKSNSLNRHLAHGWQLSAMLDQFVEPVPAQMNVGRDWYKGSADAIYQNLNIITDEEPDLIAVFGSDHIYKMDVRQMIDYHRAKKATVTVAAIPVPVEEARAFGVIHVDESGRMIDFIEKPAEPPEMPGRPGWALASMGNYLFSTDVLIRELTRDAEQESSHDFGRDIISSVWRQEPTYVYDFDTNDIPGQQPAEVGYWRDVGTIDAYWRSSMDLVSVTPSFSLYNPDWPVHTSYYHYPPAKFVFANHETHRLGIATDSLVSEGCIVSGGHIDKSVLSPGVRINSFSHVTESVLFNEVEIGRRCKIRRAIIDKGVSIPEGTVIGYDPEEDRRRFFVSEGGVVVIPKGGFLSQMEQGPRATAKAFAGG